VNEVEMSRYITETFKDVDVVVNSDNSFFFYNPDPDNLDHMFPFTTLMVNDVNDQFSNLDREGVYRLNIGVSKQTFQSLFGLPKSKSGEDSATEGDEPDSRFDYTAFDQLMPHPVYGRMYWVCILNPSDETFKMKVYPLLAEAYKSAVGKYQKKAARTVGN
jgi:hypothetical protein